MNTHFSPFRREHRDLAARPVVLVERLLGEVKVDLLELVPAPLIAPPDIAQFIPPSNMSNQRASLVKSLRFKLSLSLDNPELFVCFAHR